MKRRPIAITVLTVAVFAATVGPVAAAWNVPGQGAGAARAAQLQAPAAAPVTATSAGTHLTWTAPSTGPSPTGYLVTRDGTTVCTTTTATSCDDTNLAPGTTYTYLVSSTAGRYWVSATPLTMTARTASGGFALAALTPANTTAGVELSFTLLATYGSDITDAAYTGPHPLTITSSLPGSPGGKTSGGQVTPTFTAGVAKVVTTVYGSGAQTLTVSDGSRTRSIALAVSPASVATMELIDAVTGAVVCTPNGHLSLPAGKQQLAKVAVVDAYGNLASAGSTLSIGLSFSASGVLSGSSATIAAGKSLSNSTVTLSMPATGTKSGTLSITGPGTLSTSCSVN